MFTTFFIILSISLLCSQIYYVHTRIVLVEKLHMLTRVDRSPCWLGGVIPLIVFVEGFHVLTRFERFPMLIGWSDSLGYLVISTMIHDHVVLRLRMIPQFTYDIYGFSLYLHEACAFICIVIILQCYYCHGFSTC